MSLLQEAEPMRVRAALSRDGVEVYGEALYLIIVLTLGWVVYQYSFGY